MYQSAIKRYASSSMSTIWSDETKFQIWRELWVALARVQHELGLPVTDEQVEELDQHIFDINIERAEEIERETHHDVMAHIKAYAEQCPIAAPIIHLGATSCYITDNADVIRIAWAMEHLSKKLRDLLQLLADKAMEYKDTMCLAYTHFQRAQPTTAGKRFALWLQDFAMDCVRLEGELKRICIVGCVGTVGTSASFYQLFDYDAEKVEEFEQRINYLLGFPAFAVSGQTYSRKQDFFVMQALSGIAQSASKMANDIRLLSNTEEVREGFAKNQVGSSAMPYKKNPVNAECIVSLSRRVICETQNSAHTAANQWLERSLDDSANRRIGIADTFTLVDSILDKCYSLTDTLVVNDDIMYMHICENKLEICSEHIIAYCVSEKGMDRQQVHEMIREITVNHTPERMWPPETIDIINDALYNINSTVLVGLAPKQTEDFVKSLAEKGFVSCGES